RRFSRRRRLRIAARDLLTDAPPLQTIGSLSDTADAALVGALRTAAPDSQPGLCVIAMGKWGGRELSYGSDVDLMYVFGDEADRDSALGITSDLSHILTEPSRHGDGYQLDASIRPEGRAGPMARSLDSYRTYYEKWAEPWELLALVKARAAAGDKSVAADFFEAVSPFLWRESLPGETLLAIRNIKARVENERIPAGEDPDYHLKLGPGGLSDVEFLVQLFQLKHGYGEPDVRVAGTIDALTTLQGIGSIGEKETDALRESYIFCTRVRLRLHLQAGTTMNSLPTDPTKLARLAASLGFDRTSDLREEYRKVTRRARDVFERRFYE
ncbi:MAG: bifunctional [glutamine synthetase] adenylyltransferase/[glutamine synthetase]-adenylyl-L-tyrosine phosphorylase, partial [Acidimicrobiia bacterium]